MLFNFVLTKKQNLFLVYNSTARKIYLHLFVQEKYVTYLNSNNGKAILAFESVDSLFVNSANSLDAIQNFIDKHKGKYIFVALSYDLKNDIELLHSKNLNKLKFPKAILWVAKNVVKFNEDQYEFISGEECLENIQLVQSFLKESNQKKYPPLNIEFKNRISFDDYVKNVNQLKEEIQQGNIYEVNYCQEFYAENVELTNPLDVYFKLNQITKAPYSTYFRAEEFSIFSGSPELYLNKKENVIKSSPIKGTRKRGKNREEDERMKVELKNDLKEQAENVMIVDLVRNDLSRIAQKKSVKVDELMGIYSFETVHQMISTISCRVDDEILFSDILRATFPMGSMTGAPKISAMLLIEKHEAFQRGIYSGSIGYISPNGDFDFNVVIRSLIYNAKEKYLSCPVGGAITINANAGSEFKECNVKVKGILDQMNA